MRQKYSNKHRTQGRIRSSQAEREQWQGIKRRQTSLVHGKVNYVNFWEFKSAIEKQLRETYRETTRRYCE